MSIFVSIVSYCDPMLAFTLRRAFERARRPQALRFGIVDQSRPGGHLSHYGAVPDAQVRMVHVDASQARGPCWARAVAMSLYQGEDWFLQVDSHTDFEPDWDERFMAQSRALAAVQPQHVISSYPPAFEMHDGQPVRKPSTEKVLAHVVRPGATFEAAHLALAFEAHPVEQDAPVRGFHLGAGCIFAPGRFVQRFPYDPGFYFHGEEQSMSLRLFTHGWDIFHMSALPVSHLYTVGPATRPLHWDEAEDARRAERWWQLEEVSRRRLDLLARGDPDLGVFGLGAVRSVADYAHFCGIDYAARTVDERAWQGPWSLSDRAPVDTAPSTGSAGAGAGHAAPAGHDALGHELNAQWMAWLAENLGRGCDARELQRILLDAGFSPGSVRRHMGPAWPDPAAPVDPRILAAPPLVRRTLPGLRRIDTETLQLWLIDDFLTPQECEALMAVVERAMRPAIGTPACGPEGVRTSHTCDLDPVGEPLVLALDHKISRALGVSLAYASGSRARHADAVPPTPEPADGGVPIEDESQGAGAGRGRRVWNFLVCLNEGMKGGGVYFPALNRTFYPVRGRAVVWSQLLEDGRPNPDGRHRRMPVHNGREVTIIQGFCECGEGPVFLDD